VICGSNLFDDFDELKVVLEVFALESRVLPAPVGFIKVTQTLNPSREKPSADGTLCHEANPEFAERREHLFFSASFPKRILRLNGGDWMHSMCAANGSGTDFREANLAHFAFSNEISKRACGVFNGSIGIQAMLIVKVDVIRA
jgi:hypothetical protein